MNNSEPIGSWTTWARYVIETLKSVCESINKLETRLDEFEVKEDCENERAELKTSISLVRSSLTTVTADLNKQISKFEAHVEKHEYKWKIIAGLSALIGFLLLVQKVIEMLKG